MLTRPGVTTAPPRSTRSSASGGAPPPTASTRPSARAPSRRRAPSPRRPSTTTWALGEQQAHRRASGTSSNRSTSTSPRSVIFSAGITESARNAIVRNGVAPLQPSAARRVGAGAALRDHLVERRDREQAGDRQRALARTIRPPSTATMPPPSSTTRWTAASMSSSETPSDDDVVRVVRDRRGERAAPQARSRATKPEPDAARGEVALDDRDLREVARRVGDRDAVLDASARSTSDSVTTWSGHEPDHARRPPPFHGTRSRRGRAARCAPTAGPTRARRAARSRRSRRPALSTSSGRKRLEVGQDEQVGLVAGRDGAEVTQPVPARRVERRDHDRVRGRDARRRPLRAPSR